MVRHDRASSQSRNPILSLPVSQIHSLQEANVIKNRKLRTAFTLALVSWLSLVHTAKPWTSLMDVGVVIRYLPLCSIYYRPHANGRVWFTKFNHFLKLYASEQEGEKKRKIRPVVEPLKTQGALEASCYESVLIIIMLVSCSLLRHWSLLLTSGIQVKVSMDFNVRHWMWRAVHVLFC